MVALDSISDADLDREIQRYQKQCAKPAHLQKQHDRARLDQLYMERIIRHGEATCEEEAEITDLLGDNIENHVLANYAPKDIVDIMAKDGYRRELAILLMRPIRRNFRRRFTRRLIVHLILFLAAAGGLVYLHHTVPWADLTSCAWWKAQLTGASTWWLAWPKISPLAVGVITFFGGLNAGGELAKVLRDYDEA
jgi:hypothetical protein